MPFSPEVPGGAPAGPDALALKVRNVLRHRTELRLDRLQMLEQQLVGNSFAADLMTARTDRRHPVVDRTIRECKIRLRELPMSPGMVRLRRVIGKQASWNVELSGAACHLKDFF